MLSTCWAMAGIEEKPRNDTTDTCATAESRFGISVQKVSSHKRPDKSSSVCFIIGAIMARDIYQAVRDACLWLPEAEEFVSHGSPNFRVRGKTFATYVVNHHGDGRVALWLNAPPGKQELHVESEPEHFFVPPYVGPRGWLGVILDHGIEWNRIPALVREGYEKVAPGELRARIGKTPKIKAPGKALSASQIDPFKSARALTVLSKLRKICLSYPESSEGSQFGHPMWRAGKKTFVIPRYAGPRFTPSFLVCVVHPALSPPHP